MRASVLDAGLDAGCTLNLDARSVAPRWAARGGTPAQEGVGSEGRGLKQLIAYQALLSDPASVAQVRALKREIERAGGRVGIAPPTRLGMVLVILELPDGVTPDQLFPGMAFYPV